MASLPSLPEELKFINPYLQRAQETRKREPVISYYCDYYAAKLALENGTKSKESKIFLAKLLDMLEQEKKGLVDNEAVTNDMAGEAYVENFALKVFTMADNEDRTGKATIITAKTFLAASSYMELLKIFGNISPEFEDKRKYAKWKAIDIMKALKEGRTPVPGPPGGEPDLDLQQPGSEENNQIIPGIDQFPSAPISSGTTTTATGPSDNDPFPIFPSTPTHDYQQKPPSNDSVSNVQGLTSSFDQMDMIGKQVAPALPPKGNDYAGNNNNNNNNNIFDNQFNQQPSALNFPSVPNTPNAPNANFYDMHQNYQQPPPAQHPFTNEKSPPAQHPFTNDYAQPHYHQQPPPPPPHNSFIPPPQAPPQNYIQPVNAPQQPSFSVPAAPITYTQGHQNYGYSQPQPSHVEIDPNTVTEVQKYSKFANSALDYNDVKTAVEYLNKALETLKPYNK